MEEINYLKLFNFSFSFVSTISTIKIREFLNNILHNRKMCDTKIPLKIIATSLDTGMKKVFDNKSDIKLIDAVIASFSVPGLFEPMSIGTERFADGILSSNLPLEESSYDNILAVDVMNSHFLSIIPKYIPHIMLKSHYIMVLNQTRYKIKNDSSLRNRNITMIEPDLSGYQMHDFLKWEKIAEIGYDAMNKPKLQQNTSGL